MLKKPLLKYCGSRTYQDWMIVTKSNADYIGLIFAPSKRRVLSEVVKEWMIETPLPVQKKLVGVFVNATLEEINQVLRDVPLDTIQCHGNESFDEVYQIKKQTGLKIWKVIHHLPESLEIMKSYKGVVDGYLVDTKQKGAWGGTGQAFDWSYIPSYLKESTSQGVPCWIAGGVNHENISDLLPYNPFGIDISSGIEKEDKKDQALIKNLEEKVFQIC